MAMANKYLDEAKEIRSAINTFALNQTDETLIDNKTAFALWSGDGVQVKAGEIYRYSDDIYRVVQPHTTQPDWTPDKVPALFTKISVEEFPEWVQPTGAQDAYMTGDKVSHNGKNWQSNTDNNVWEPGVYGWDEVFE